MNEEDHAIVVGISKYPRFGENGVKPLDLQGPDNDATSIHDWLTDPSGGGVPKKQATLIRSQDFEPFSDESEADPQAAAIEKEFQGLRERAKTNSLNRKPERLGRRLYLYFSGHGYAPERLKGAIFGANATIENTDLHFPATAYATWLVDATYFDEVVLWMDCCMVRSLSVPIKGAFSSTVTSQSGKLFAAYAARWRKQAVEQQMTDGKYHGVFTYALLQGLRGEAADPDTKQITSEGLKKYLIHAMPRLMNQENQKNPNISQEPDFGPVDDMVFGSVSEAPRHTVTVSLPKSAIGKMLTVDGGSLAKPLSQAISGRNETLQLPNGIYMAEVDSLGTIGFKVVGGQVHVQIGK